MQTSTATHSQPVDKEVTYRSAVLSDVRKLSVLYTQCYIHAYAIDGVSDEYANFITRQFSTERLSQAVSEHPGNIIVAEYDGNLVGVVEVAFDQKCPLGELVAPELNKLYVLQWFGSQGIGHRLLQESERLVRSKGEKQMWLWAWDQNPRAIAFYERQGYRVVGPAPCPMEQNDYVNIVMVKQLS